MSILIYIKFDLLSDVYKILKHTNTLKVQVIYIEYK